MSNVGSVTYQRNQIEQAIARIEDLATADGTIPAALRSNVKRLLDIDRKPRAKKLDSAPERFAFYDEGEAPGHGTEIAYRPYHAFALLIGTRLISSGMPQSRAVMLLREVRTELEHKFEELAGKTTDRLPDLSDEEQAMRARSGVLVDQPESMTFLIARAGPDAEAILVPGPDRRELATGNVCDFDDLKNRLRFFSHMGQGAMVIELANAVFQLLAALPRTQVRRRGRS